MQLEYIEPFLESAFEIFEEVLGEKVQRGQLYLKNLGESMADIAVIIGLTSNACSGRIAFDMSKDTALKIASTLNMEEMADFDSLASSTIAELANMVTGRAITKLDKNALKFEFTPPSVIGGQNLEFFDSQKVEAVIIPIETSMGVVEINISIEPN